MSNGQGGFIPMPVNLATVQEADDFPLYPVGDYLLKTVSVEQQQPEDTSKSPRLSVKSEIQQGPGPMGAEFNGKAIFDNFNLDAKGFPYLKKWLLRCGFTDAHLSNWAAQGVGIPVDQLTGLTFVGRLAHREYNGQKYNNLVRYSPANEFGQSGDGGGAPAQGAAAPQPGMLAPPPSQAPPQQQFQQPPMQQPPQQFQQPQQPVPQQQFQQPVPQQPMQQPQQPMPQQQFQAPQQAPQPQPGPNYPAAPPPPGQIPGQG